MNYLMTNETLMRVTQVIKDTSLKLFSDSLKNIILYGSYAREDYDNESDIDIFILVDKSPNELAEYNSDMYSLASRLSMESKNCVTVSIALQDLQTFNKYKEFLPYYINIEAEGVIIYAA